MILFIVLPLFEKGVGQIAGIRNSSQSIRLRLLESENVLQRTSFAGALSGKRLGMQGQRSTKHFQFVWVGLGVCLDEAAGRRVTVGLKTWRALVSVLRATVCSGFSDSRGGVDRRGSIRLRAVIWLLAYIWLCGAPELGREYLLHQVLPHFFPKTC